MKILFYSTKNFELPCLKTAATDNIEASFITEPLNLDTVHLSEGYDGVSIFTGDDASQEVLLALKDTGIKYIATRAAGYDNIDISVANDLHIHVANVPEYSPYAIAEHAVAMMLALNRKVVKANEQVHKQNFTVTDLIGFDLYKKKAGIIGTGRIGSTIAGILHGFGCSLFAFDVQHNPDLEQRLGVTYTTLENICKTCDIITLHVPLNKETKYLVNEDLLKKMKPGVMLINTSRGALVNTNDLIEAIKSGHIGYYGMDVYEKEKGLFFYDRSGEDLHDPMLDSLMKFPNVLITPHQAFATNEALKNIADTTFLNLSEWKNGNIPVNEITHCAEEVF